MRRVLSFLCLATLCSLTIAVQAGKVTCFFVDEDHHPVAGAQVTSVFPHSDEHVVTTGDLGRYWIQGDLPMDKMAVIAMAPGFAIAAGPVQEGEQTFTLHRPTPFTCRLLTEDKSPLAHARVVCTAVELDGHQVTIPSCFAEACSARSDAQGNVTFAFLPASGKISVLVADPRVQAGIQQITIVPSYAIHPHAINLSKGLTAHGRVLSADGTPLAHQRVTVDRYNYLTAETGTDGTFHLKGLSAETTSLTVSDPERKMLPASLANIKLSQNTETVLSDITMQRGYWISGTVTDAETHASMANVNVSIYSAIGNTGSVDTKTDAAGKYAVQCGPGTYVIQAFIFSGDYYIPTSGIQSTSDGEVRFLENDGSRTILNIANADKVQDLTLRHGVRYSGVVQEEQGKPISNADVHYGVSPLDDMHRKWIKANDQGRFTTETLPKGEKITFDTQFYAGCTTDWVIVSPKDPVTDPTQPVTVVVRRNLYGRIVDTHGVPLDVPMTVEYTYSQLRDPNNLAADAPRDDKPYRIINVSGGKISLPILQHGDRVTVTSVIGDGAKLVTPGVLREENGTFRMTDTVMERYESTVHGRVLAADGTPHGGVVVFSPDCQPVPRATTDAQGNFTLTKLPSSKIRLIAASAQATGTLTAPVGEEPVTLTLHPVTIPAPCDVTRAIDLLSQDAQLPKEQRIFNENARRRAFRGIFPIDSAKANALANAINLRVTDDLRGDVLIGLLQRDPDGNAQRVPTELELITDPKIRCEAALKAGMALASHNSMMAEHCAALAAGILRGENPKSRLWTALDSVYLDTLLHHADAAQRLVVLEPLAGREPYITGRILAIKCQQSPEEADAYLAGMSDKQRKQAVFNACCYVLSRSPEQITPVLPILRKYQQLLTNGGYSSDHIWMYAQLGKADPVQAMALAREIRENMPRYIAVLAAAIYQPQANALAGYREALANYRVPALGQGYPENDASFDFGWHCLIAARAAQLDAATGRQMLNDLKSALDDLKKRRGSDIEKEACYAFALSVLDPVEARILLEACYTRASAADRLTLRYLPTFMAAVDYDRALAMLDEIRKVDSQNAIEAANMLARYLLADAEERREFVASTSIRNVPGYWPL